MLGVFTEEIESPNKSLRANITQPSFSTRLGLEAKGRQATGYKQLSNFIVSHSHAGVRNPSARALGLSNTQWDSGTVKQSDGPHRSAQTWEQA